MMERKTSNSAGYDLRATESGTLLPGHRAKIPLDLTGLQVAWPRQSYAMLEMRSGLAANFGLIRLGGVIDMDFEDTIGLIVYNSGLVPWSWTAGDRVCQLIIQPYLIAMDDQAVVTAKRGGGFGSTGA